MVHKAYTVYKIENYEHSLYNNWYALHKLNLILLKHKCTPALWSSCHFLSTHRHLTLHTFLIIKIDIHKGVLLGRGYIHCRFLLWEIYVTSGACVSTICTCLLHALLRTIEEPDNMKLWHFMKSALQFLQKLQKFWNQILLNTRHQFFLMILTPLGKLIKHVLLLKSMRFWRGL